MQIEEALEDLDVETNVLTDKNINELDTRGYTVIDGLIDNILLSKLRDRFEELCSDASNTGILEHESGTRRLSDLVNKGEIFDQIWTNPTLLAAIHHVIGRDFKLSALNARDALPGEGLQKLHPDWPNDYDGSFHVCNSIWLLDEFTTNNGCTRLVPGTHVGKHPDNVLKDPMAKHPTEEYLVAPAGSVAVFNSHVWHGGTLNRTQNTKRRALHCYFAAREHEQYLDQKKFIRHETWKRMSRGARHILDVDLD